MKKLLFILSIFISVVASSQIPQHAMHVLAGQGSGGTTLKTDLISIWELNETTGTDVFDAHANNDGVNTGAIINQAGVTNLTPCYLFGSGDNINFGDVEDMSFTNGSDLPFAISTWIDPSSIGTNQGLFAKSQTSYEYFLIIRSTGRILLRLYSQNSSSNAIDRESDIALSASGGWYHVVVNYDGSESETGIDIYINGTLQNGTAVESGTYVKMSNTTQNVTIGYWAGNYLNGYQDQTAIWSKELTTTEISVLYNSGNGLAYPSW